MTFPLAAMRHLPFFEVLAAQSDDTDSSIWHECQTAIVVLRLLTDWAESPTLATVTTHGVTLLKEHLAKTEDDTVKHLLGTILSDLLHPKTNDPALILGPFLAYAWTLEERLYFELAADVLQTVVDVVDPPSGPIDQEWAIIAHRRAGDLFHRHRQFDSAETSYNRARLLAESAGDHQRSLDIQTRLAGVQESRGNLGNAESMLAAIIDEAQSKHLTRTESFARRARATTMLRRNRTGDALSEFYAAFVIAPDDLEREWLLGGIAGCASLLGLRDTARLIHQALAKTAHNQAAQSTALVNLLEIAVWDDDQETFQKIWQDLLQRDLARDLKLHASLFSARGVEQWEGSDAAEKAYAVLAEEARQVGVHDIEFAALEALDRLHNRRGQANVNLPTSMPTLQPEWKDIAASIEADCRLRLLTTE